MTNRNRKTIRLKNYDYQQNGFYFITICTQNREHLFGKILNNQHIIFDAGLMIKSVWYDLSKYYTGIQVYDFVLMPNHIHGIIEFKNSNLNLSEIIRRFKTFTTRQYINGIHDYDWKPFHKKLWQRNYHEHIIRNDISFYKLQNYIENNPRQWNEDIFYGG